MLWSRDRVHLIGRRQDGVPGCLLEALIPVELPAFPPIYESVTVKKYDLTGHADLVRRGQIVPACPTP